MVRPEFHAPAAALDAEVHIHYPTPRETLLKIAHRGASGTCPENTAVALETAIASSVDMIDLDCRMSKDGHIVVIHDETLNRTTNGSGLVTAKTLDQLKALDAGSWFHRKFKNERILTLEEVLHLAGGRSGFIVEIKNQGQVHLGIELRMLFVLNQARALRRSIVSSRDYRALRRLRELSQDVRIGVLMTAAEREDPLVVAKELKPSVLLIRKDLLSPRFLREANRRGLLSLVCTVNETPEMKRYAAMGVAGIVTDFPERLSALKIGRPQDR